MVPTESSNETSQPKTAVEQEGHAEEITKVNLRLRLKHFTFAWFLSTMSTGGLAIALAETPHQFRGIFPFSLPTFSTPAHVQNVGLYHIGLTVFISNIVLFLTLCALTIARLALHPKHFLGSFTNPQESLFLGSFWLSVSVIIGGIQSYGITLGPAYPWLVDTVYLLYWVYAGCSLLNFVFQYWVLIAWSTVRPIPYSPSIFLAGYSAMLTGTIASLIAKSQPEGRRMGIIVSGTGYQGFGWCISFIAIASAVRTLLDNGLPPPQLRPGMFIPVGTCAYTIVAFLGMANAIPADMQDGYFARHTSAPETLRVLALFVGIFLWLFAFWLFAIAFLGNISVMGNMPFSLTWWAFIFPNIGFMLSTAMIGREVESEAVLWVASVMTVCLVGIWLVAAVGCIKAVWSGRIVWPGQDEDKNR